MARSRQSHAVIAPNVRVSLPDQVLNLNSITSPSCDDIFLAFVARLAGFLGRHFAAERDEVVIGDGLGADEAALEIGVDDAGRLRRLGALARSSRRASPSGRR